MRYVSSADYKSAKPRSAGFRMLDLGKGRTRAPGNRGALKPLAAVGIPSPDHEQPRVSPAHATREGPEATPVATGGALPIARASFLPQKHTPPPRNLDSQLGAILGERPEYRPRCRVLGCENTDGTRTALEPRDNATWYACPACGRQYTLAADLQALGQTQPAMTGPEVAQALGLSKHTIRSWASRGLLSHESRDHKGRKLYDLDLVRRIAQRTRER